MVSKQFLLQVGKIVALLSITLGIPLAIKFYYPAIDYSSDFIAGCALFLTIYLNLIKKKKELKTEYHIDIKGLVGDYYYHLPLKLRMTITNSGEKKVTVTPAYIDFEGIRFEASRVKDEKGDVIERSVPIRPSVYKEITVEFSTESASFNNLSNRLVEAFNKNDERLVEGIKDNKGRFVWYDGSGTSQQKDILLGSLFFTRLKTELKK